MKHTDSLASPITALFPWRHGLLSCRKGLPIETMA
jgi:hypothetical protein